MVSSELVRRVDRGMIVVDLEKTEAYIPRKEQIPGEQYKSGDRIQGYLLEVRQTTRGPQIIMSRAHEQYLIKLFENEVPEVSEGIVKIVAAARDPGQRAKMSVYSTDPAVHPVGSCVGVKGSRVQNITQELKGERVDVIMWDNDSVQYICNAMAPAKISKILMDEDQKSMQIIVPDDQLSLAIGKKGQNVRLAVKLTGWNLNLVSEEESKKSKKEALFNLSLLSVVTETKAQSLVQYGYSNLEQLAQAQASDLKSIPEFEEESVAKKLIQSAKDILKKYAEEGKELPKLEDVKEDKKPLASSLKEQAEEILKRELAQLEGKKTNEESSEEEMTENVQPEKATVQEAKSEESVSSIPAQDTKAEKSVSSTPAQDTKAEKLDKLTPVQKKAESKDKKTTETQAKENEKSKKEDSSEENKESDKVTPKRVIKAKKAVEKTSKTEDQVKA